MSKGKSAKSSTRPSISPAMFRTTGPAAKLRVNDKCSKLYYFSEKIKVEQARELALKEGAELLSAAPDSLSVGAPALKYEFYCAYDAVMTMRFLVSKRHELSVAESVVGVAIDKLVLQPTKGKEVPGPVVTVDMVELHEMKRSDSMVVDGQTGLQAEVMAALLKGPGKVAATSAWLGKAKVVPGKFNSIDKVVKEIGKVVLRVPPNASRLVEASLDFKQLDGYYVPVYYVSVSHGGTSKILRVNAVNGSVALKV
ncbi:MAG: hypothetical protein QXS20_02570 [Candidatus Thorarchaeota archaeon]